MKNVNKSLILILLSTMSIFMISCTQANTPDTDAKTAHYTHFKPKKSLSDVKTRIIQTGKKNGWRMTEFKDNAVIAEKFSDDATQAVTIEFSKNSFHVTPQNDALSNILEEELQK